MVFCALVSALITWLYLLPTTIDPVIAIAELVL
jgi:hypothetical protein